MTSPIISPLAGQAEVSAITNLLNIIRNQHNPDGNAPAGAAAAPASGLDAGRGMGNFGGFVGSMVGGPVGGMVGRVGGSALGAGIAANRANDIASMFGLTDVSNPAGAAARAAGPAAAGALAGLAGIPGLSSLASMGMAGMIGRNDPHADLENALAAAVEREGMPAEMSAALTRGLMSAMSEAPAGIASTMDPDFGPNTPSFGMANHADYGGPAASGHSNENTGSGVGGEDGGSKGDGDNYARGGLIGLPNRYAKGGVARVRDERAVDWMANDGDRNRRNRRKATGVVINPEEDPNGAFYHDNQNGQAPPPDMELHYPDEHFDMDPNEEFDGVSYRRRINNYATGGKIVRGPGTGLDDLVPTTIDGRRAAALSDGEFVIPADVVSMMGDGSTDAGSRRLYDLIKNVRQNKTGTNDQAGPLPIGNILQRVLR